MKFINLFVEILDKLTEKMIEIMSYFHEGTMLLIEFFRKYYKYFIHFCEIYNISQYYTVTYYIKVILLLYFHRS